MRDKTLLIELYEQHGFAEYIRHIKELRPPVPRWDKDRTQNDWIYESGFQAGFDFVLSHFEGEP